MGSNFLRSHTDGLTGVGYGHEDEGHLTEQQVLVRLLYYKRFPRGAAFLGSLCSPTPLPDFRVRVNPEPDFVLRAHTQG